MEIRKSIKEASTELLKDIKEHPQKYEYDSNNEESRQIYEEVCEELRRRSKKIDMKEIVKEINKLIGGCTMEKQKVQNSIEERLMDGRRVLSYSYNPPTKTFLVHVVTGLFSAEWVKPNAYWRRHLEKIVEKESGGTNVKGKRE